MYREIVGAGSGQVVDHKDGDGLNNTRENLRVCSRSDNEHNRRIDTKNSSGFKGVYFNKPMKKWMARISINNKRMYLGCYDNKVDAARAYDKAAKKHFGEFARLNISN